MNKIKATSFAAVLIVTALPTFAADLAGYLVDSGGSPVRTGFGACIRTASWSPTMPGSGCDFTPDRIVLLPGPDGQAGAVIVRTGGNEKVLAAPYDGVEVSANTIATRREDAASVQARYGKVLASQPPRPLSFTLYFVSGSSNELTAESRQRIDTMKAALIKRPAPEIVVIGHTDRVGNVAANDMLSLKRAETVRDLLVAAGVQASNLEVAGRGEREPLIATADEVAEARNRRVEISVR